MCSIRPDEKMKIIFISYTRKDLCNMTYAHDNRLLFVLAKSIIWGVIVW